MKPANRLRNWRQRHRLSLRELADLTGLSAGMLSRVERGERRLSPMARVALARRLGVRVGDLFDPDELDELANASLVREGTP